MARTTPSGRFHGATLAERDVAGLKLVERRYAAALRTPLHAHERAYAGLVLEGCSRQSSRGREIERGPMTALLFR